MPSKGIDYFVFVQGSDNTATITARGHEDKRYQQTLEILSKHVEIDSESLGWFEKSGRFSFTCEYLRGRAPIQQGTGAGLSTRRLGQCGGTETNTMRVEEMPAHTHTAAVTASATVSGTLRASSGDPDGTSPVGSSLSEVAEEGYSSAVPDVDMHAGSVTVAVDTLKVDVTNAKTGDDQQQNNMQPYLPVNFIIALQGEYPSRN